jgi:hypothetical protein
VRHIGPPIPAHGGNAYGTKPQCPAEAHIKSAIKSLPIV